MEKNNNNTFEIKKTTDIKGRGGSKNEKWKMENEKDETSKIIIIIKGKSLTEGIRRGEASTDLMRV